MNAKTRRSAKGLGIAALAAAAMATAIPLATATPAAAVPVGCNLVPVHDDWEGLCYRRPTDGDSGGVSGAVKINNVRNPNFGSIEFRAKGENFYLNTKGQSAAFTAWYIRDGRAHYFFDRLRVGANSFKFVDKDLSEGRTVWIRACVTQGCATLKTLRS
ncbi:hypothetical protein [Streptomyces sp. BA2]|uniref:hypothetical protein n=1 Tax=Streptomyces sp. BA2 TaxID=436595 RepID=UPI001321F1DD|nr:hypothetical protein [Streptomyces sp. BA2]MWA16128.1 hypothetical protein [Streptomyces sp. BA2]